MMAEASAPANIALIKYMGKANESSHLPANGSLSFTLEHFRTFVRITPLTTRASGPASVDRWQPLKGDGHLPMALSSTGLEKFLKHFAFLKSELGLDGSFLIESANNFPSDCGLASSASSFAALTLAAHELRKAMLRGTSPAVPVPRSISMHQLARWSRLGSGSSIRSFAGPWVLWRGEDYEPVDLPEKQILHSVIVVESRKKEVSSSEAHRRVVSSLLYKGRAERAEHRLTQLLQALEKEHWKAAFEISWAEFWDMHALFETSQPPFGYMDASSLQVLRKVQEVWRSGDGPIATMDAGANVHLLFRAEQAELKARLAKDLQSIGQVL